MNSYRCPWMCSPRCVARCVGPFVLPVFCAGKNAVYSREPQTATGSRTWKNYLLRRKTKTKKQSSMASLTLALQRICPKPLLTPELLLAATWVRRLGSLCGMSVPSRRLELGLVGGVFKPSRNCICWHFPLLESMC